MQELIKITERQNGDNVVSARDLYTFLGVNSVFTTWCKRMFSYGFEENIDFIPFLEESTGGRPSTDYALTIDTAKEISMLQRTDKGKEARRYFIEVEKKANKPMDILDYMEYSVKMLRKQSEKMNEFNDRIVQLEAKTTTRPDYFTIAGYATIKGIQCGLKLASSLGRKASALCKKRGIQTESIPDPRFGRVKTYPQTILNEVFKMSIA